MEKEKRKTIPVESIDKVRVDNPARCNIAISAFNLGSAFS